MASPVLVVRISSLMESNVSVSLMCLMVALVYAVSVFIVVRLTWHVAFVLYHYNYTFYIHLYIYLRTSTLNAIRKLRQGRVGIGSVMCAN